MRKKQRQSRKRNNRLKEFDFANEAKGIARDLETLATDLGKCIVMDKQHGRHLFHAAPTKLIAKRAAVVSAEMRDHVLDYDGKTLMVNSMSGYKNSILLQSVPCAD